MVGISEIYSLSDSISIDKPIITWNHNVFYIAHVLKAFDYPIVDVLNKPFTESDVRNVVNKMINYSSVK